MLTKYFTILLCCLVCGIHCLSSFIDKGQRAELFEIMDNEVPTFKITLPEEEYSLMKEKANIGRSEFFGAELNSKQIMVFLDLYKKVVESYIKNIKLMNFNKYFPDVDLQEEFPQLKIGEDGFPSYDVDEVLYGFDFLPENYKNFSGILEIVYFLFSSNENFNLMEILTKMETLVDTEKMREIEEILNNFNLNNFEDIKLSNQDETDEIDNKDFKTKNATMSVQINGNEKYFEKVTFSLGGEYSRQFPRPGFNLKIRGKNDLYGRKQFKIRSDCNEPTYLRTKLVSDMHNHLKLPSVSANYIQLYINNEFMGLYILSDAYKPSWVEYVYGEKDTTNLYKCTNIRNLSLKYSGGCINEDKEATDDSEWLQFLSSVENATSPEDLEDIFEIDYFLKEMALDYLLGSWDHIQNTHNFYLYKQPNGKWIYLSHDFDHDFGQPFYDSEEQTIKSYFYEFIDIIDILILKDTKRFEKALKEVVMEVFNPGTLYPRIDELKEFIKPYVLIDKTPNENGEYPGEINYNAIDNHNSMEQWDAYSEFTTGFSDQIAFGLKYWVLVQYRNVCHQFDMECDPIYMDENYEYPVVKELEYVIPSVNQYMIDNYNIKYSKSYMKSKYQSSKTGNDHSPTETVDFEETMISTELPTEIPTESIIEDPTSTVDTFETEETSIIVENPTTTTTIENTAPTTIENTTTTIVKTKTVMTTSIPTPTDTPIPTNLPKENAYQCWAELTGYPCCPEGVDKVYAQDEYGDWSYDFENQVWCGLTPYVEPASSSDFDEECWSEKLGYSCCKGCKVFETDRHGSWGYESHHWCGIPTYCQN